MQQVTWGIIDFRLVYYLFIVASYDSISLGMHLCCSALTLVNTTRVA